MTNTRKMKVARWLLLISGLLIIAWGVFMLFSPLVNLFTLAMLIGIAVVSMGITEITTYFNEAHDRRSGMALFGGIVFTMFGIQLLFGAGTVALAAMLPLLFGLLVLIYGFMRAFKSFDKRKEDTLAWLAALALGVLKIALGVLLLFYPVLSALIVASTLSVILIVHGINLVLLFYGNKELNSHLVYYRTRVVNRIFKRGVARYEN